MFQQLPASTVNNCMRHTFSLQFGRMDSFFLGLVSFFFFALVVSCAIWKIILISHSVSLSQNYTNSRTYLQHEHSSWNKICKICKIVMSTEEVSALKSMYIYVLYFLMFKIFSSFHRYFCQHVIKGYGWKMYPLFKLLTMTNILQKGILK